MVTVENREPDVGCAAEIDTDWGWRKHKRMGTKCLGAADPHSSVCGLSGQYEEAGLLDHMAVLCCLQAAFRSS